MSKLHAHVSKLSGFFLALITAMLLNSVVFIHAHRTNDRVVIHAHPFFPATENSSQSHQHTNHELILLELICNATYHAGDLFEFTPSWPLPCYMAFSEVSQGTPNDISALQLIPRAPPVVA